MAHVMSLPEISEKGHFGSMFEIRLNRVASNVSWPYNVIG